MRFRPVLALAALGLAAAASPAAAHHSGSMYDRDHPLTIGATVKSFEWINPHSVLTVQTDGTATMPAGPLAVEMSGPGVMTRAGMTKRSFLPGDHITLVYAPRREAGGTIGLYLSGVTAQGQTVSLSFKPGEAAGLN